MSSEKDVLAEVVEQVNELIKVEDKGTLARLKRCVDKDYDLSVMSETFGWRYYTWAEDVINVCVPYMAAHRKHVSGLHFVSAWKKLADQSNNEKPYDNKLRMLVKCNSVDQFENQFSGMVRQLTNAGIGFDWRVLMGDVSWWLFSGKDEGMTVIKKWIRLYWGQKNNFEQVID